MPERPSSPNRPALLLSGLMSGLGVGIALAALIEYLDTRLKSEADVKAALNLMVLATVPVLDGQAKVRVWRVAAISITAFLAATFGAVVLAWRLWK